MNNLSWFIFGAIILVILWIIFLYNKLITLRTRVEEAWSDIDIQLKRRYDLIPNLIEAVKGYMGHEASVFQEVTKARTDAMSAKTVADHATAENQLSQTLKSLFAVTEAYPELKAAENFAKLQDELSDTENKLQASRRFYNGNARDYNIGLQVFPGNLIAKSFAFTPKDFFEIEGEDERKNVKVEF